MPTPVYELRDLLLRTFAKALFARDIDAIYQVVTADFVWRLPIGLEAPFAREIDSPDCLAAYLAEREILYDEMRFNDVVYHHAPEVTLMTFHLTGRWRATGKSFSVLGMERYTFSDGKIALKDAYWKQIAREAAVY